MANVNKDTWPKTPAGTVDWEAVFEDPATGILGMIRDAETAPDLRDISTVVIRKLFAREKDTPEIERFISELDTLIPDDAPPAHLPVVAEAIITTLRGIKELRKQKAREYEEEQAAKAAAAAAAGTAVPAKPAERRKQTADPRLSFQAALERQRRQNRNLTIGLGALGAVAAVGLYLWMSRVPPLPSDAAQILAQQIKSAITGVAPQAHIYGGRLAVGREVGEIVVTADGIPVDACIAAAARLVGQGKLSIDAIELRSLGAAKDLCERNGPFVRLTWISGR